MAERILKGIRVLDFTWMLAGPYASRMLADFGAEVIKVQSKRTARGTESNLGGYFNTWNRNKRSITLDMSHPEARGLVLKLTRKSDVVIENFSPRVMSNWGLDYENLKEAKPDLIMVRMSAMGQQGPWKDYAAFAPTLHALSGITYLTSFSKETPLGLGFAYADFVAGLYAVLATLAALEYRDKTGIGQYIDLSEFEALCTLMGPSLIEASLHHKEIYPQGNRPDHIPVAPYGCYRCLGEDRWCVIAVLHEEEWKSFCHVLAVLNLTKDDRFSTLAGRKENAEALDRLIEEWTIQHTPEEAVRLLQEAGVPAGIVQNAEDLWKDAHLAARNFFKRLKHPVLGETISEASPIRFEDGPEAGWKAAPLLGQDNRYVFRELLGLTEEEFSSYMEKGIIA